ncbi:MAG: hypothetical protein AABY10_03960 [Nanoarchaeota archaeon]
MQGTERYHSVDHSNEAFQELDSGFFTRLKNKIIGGAKWFIPGLITGTAIGGIGGLLYYLENKEQPPRIKEILSERAYQEFTLDDFINLPRTEKQNIVYGTYPALDFAKRNLPEIEKSGRFPDVREMAKKAQREHKMDPRLVSSWLRACYLAHDFLQEGYEKEGEKRSGISFVPLEFAREAMYNKLGTHASWADVKKVTDETNISRGVLFLKQCLERDTAPNTFARYFSESEEIASARVRSGVMDYFLGDNENDKNTQVSGFRGAGHIKTKPKNTGYRSYLPEHQTRVVDLASALYMLTDEQGNLDLDKPLIDISLINHYSWQPKKWD